MCTTYLIPLPHGGSGVPQASGSLRGQGLRRRSSPAKRPALFPPSPSRASVHVIRPLFPSPSKEITDMHLVGPSSAPQQPVPRRWCTSKSPPSLSERRFVHTGGTPERCNDGSDPKRTLPDLHRRPSGKVAFFALEL